MLTEQHSAANSPFDNKRSGKGKEIMKKLLICLTLVGIFLLILPSCSFKQNDHYGGDSMESGYGGNPLEFQSFILSETGMTAQRTVYEGYRTENGVHLECSIETGQQDDEACQHVVRAVDGDSALYREICALFGNCRIDKWAGFRGTSSLDVLDGSSMRFTAVLADGTEIEASGTNSFPPNYHTLTSAVSRLIRSEKIRSTVFGDGTYEITLPESWVGTVTASFSEGRVAFSVERTNGSELTFFIIDNDSYSYSSPSYRGRVEVGRLVSGEDVRFITARDNDSIASYADKVSENALALWESYGSDKLAIIKSFRGVNGYAFYAEDGTILYPSEARTLADSAQSLWRSLYFAGDYPGSAKPVAIKRQKYLPMFPSYFYINTLDEVRLKFLEVFSEEFTDRTLTGAVAGKSLIEYKGNVYVTCRKSTGETARNCRMDSIWDEGGGKFTIVMAVKMPSADELLYVDLPVGKNSEGRFVLTDYPYWDKSQ